MPTPDEGRVPPGRATGRAGAQTNTAPAGSDADLVATLTLHEKVLLLTGADSWSTQGADLLGLRPMIMSDGPAGARGVTLDERQPSTSLPCPSALGATWDPGLVRELAAALGRRSKEQGHSRPARAHHQPDAHAARRPRLRVLLRGSGAHRRDRGRLRPRAPECGRRGHDQALRGQRHRDAALEL